MKDIDEIRRDNLRLLDAEHGGATGAARVLGMSPAQFTNLRDGAKDSKTGKRRGMRKDTARRIEAAFGKPYNWLDVDHSFADEVHGSGLTESENLTSTVRPYSVKNPNLAPVFEWAKLGEVLFTESSGLATGEYREKPEDSGPLFKWFIADTDMPRLRIWRGWRVAVEPITSANDCIDMRTYLFRTAGDSYFLGDFRRMVDGYEALPDSGPPLDSVRHGIAVVGVFKGCLE